MEFVQRLATAADLAGDRLEALISELAPAKATRLGAAMRHAVFAGGKRFRPFLVVECATLFGVPQSSALDAAAAFECVHCYSLAHDDLPCMDDDDLRRGQPTLHRAFDEWTAILAGDALLTLAFEILALPSSHADPVARVELTALLARAAGASGMVGGQMLDLQAEKLGEPSHPTLEHVSKLHSLKTGALIAAACEAGAIVARAPGPARASLRRYGEQLGLAFQISDDLLDARGDAQVVGKATGKDSEAGKATIISLVGIERAEELLRQAEQGAINELAPFGDKAAVLCAAARYMASRSH
jgi:farnesyl diphosphate synthase